MDVFGLFKRVNRSTEILAGILFVLPAVLFIRDIFLSFGPFEISIEGALSLLMGIFGVVILLPRTIARDMLICAMVFFAAGLSCLLGGINSFEADKAYSYFLLVLGLGCLGFGYRYLRKIKDGRVK